VQVLNFDKGTWGILDERTHHQGAHTSTGYQKNSGTESRIVEWHRTRDIAYGYWTVLRHVNIEEMKKMKLTPSSELIYQLRLVRWTHWHWLGWWPCAVPTAGVLGVWSVKHHKFLKQHTFPRYTSHKRTCSEFNVLPLPVCHSERVAYSYKKKRLMLNLERHSISNLLQLWPGQTIA